MQARVVVTCTAHPLPTLVYPSVALTWSVTPGFGSEPSKRNGWFTTLRSCIRSELSFFHLPLPHSPAPPPSPLTPRPFSTKSIVNPLPPLPSHPPPNLSLSLSRFPQLTVEQVEAAGAPSFLPTLQPIGAAPAPSSRPTLQQIEAVGGLITLDQIEGPPAFVAAAEAEAAVTVEAVEARSAAAQAHAAVEAPRGTAWAAAAGVAAGAPSVGAEAGMGALMAGPGGPQSWVGPQSAGVEAGTAAARGAAEARPPEDDLVRFVRSTLAGDYFPEHDVQETIDVLEAEAMDMVT